jgi:hypothetical protein
MKHPPYHLRPNKAVDRFLLIETLQRLRRYFDFSQCSYIGLGGPFLEDFRLISQHFPEMALVSIEKSEQTHKRQVFHRPSKRVVLQRQDFSSFLSRYSTTGTDIFWLDYTDLKYSCFGEFMRVLSLIGERGVVKVTLRAEPAVNPKRLESLFETKEAEKRIEAYAEDFRAQFSEVLPADFSAADFRDIKFVELLQKMVRIAAQKALPDATGRAFQIVNSTFYSDQTQMFNLTGVVCATSETNQVRRMFRGWKHSNLDWSAPERIDVPVLSMKERLLLDGHLPCRGVKRLAQRLGYNIDEGREKSLRQLEQYVDFYRYYPQFAKIFV